MPDYIPVPVDIARQIAAACHKSMVVIVAYDPEHEVTHTTTYGVTAEDKVWAAHAGELCAGAVGCDLARTTDYEDFRRDYDPALYREALEILKYILNRHEAPMERIEQLLDAAGRIT